MCAVISAWPATTCLRPTLSHRTANCFGQAALRNPDLFWALKGGGGKFLVFVTALEYRLYPMNPMVLAGDLTYPWENAREVLNFYGERGKRYAG